jgi:hypothetical protein
MPQLEEEGYFFELPYWSSLLIRHNLDVMHIEKNICGSILGTLLKLDGKCKDRKNAQLDMEHLRVRPDQHPVIKDDKYTLPSVLYELDKDVRESLCEFLYGVKMPDGVSSKLFAAAQPVQRVDGTVVGGELQLAEARNAQPLVRPATRAAGRGLVGGAAKVGVLWGVVGVLRTACAAARPATGHRWVRPVGEERWLRR